MLLWQLNTVMVLLGNSATAMQWSGFSSILDWTRSAEKAPESSTYATNKLSSDDLRRAHSVEGNQVSSFSYFQSLFSGEKGEDLIETGSQFETQQTTEGGTIPCTPHSGRREPHGVVMDKSLTTTGSANDFKTGRSVLPTAMDSALYGLDKSAVVKTGFGAVLGNVAERHRSFLGIPYAVPPVGPNRWKKAKPIQSWIAGEVFDARKYGHHCMQLDTWESSYFRDLMVGLKTTESEDCLNLNVFAPTKARLSKLPGGKTTKIPVMVFIHGGMFTTGGASANIYNPEIFVDRNDVVVVTLNYRMSIWGFLSSNELADDSAEAGNYGLTDVLAALKWIKAHIGAFGGDSENITVAGHSAGSSMVNYLLIALGTEKYRNLGYVHRAVLFSGATGTGLIRYLDNAENDVTQQPLFNKLSASVGCDDAVDLVACLRGVDAFDLAKVGISNDWAYHWGPVVDGNYIVGTPMDVVRDGGFLPVPILVTDCIDDGTIFSVSEPTVTESDYLSIIQKYFGRSAAHRIADLYEPTASCDGTPYFQAASELLRDALITCPLDDFAGSAVESGSQAPVYYFRFLKPLSVAWLVSALPYVPDYGVFHGTELILLFQGLSQLTIGQAHAVNHIQRRIMSFMNGGVPNDPKYPDENPAKPITARLDIDKVCNQWAKWPLSPEFLEIKMALSADQQRLSFDEQFTIYSSTLVK